MGMIKRIFELTPEKDKRKGRLATVLSTVCGALLTAGVISNPVGVALLTVGATLFGGKALYHAQKTEINGEDK